MDLLRLQINMYICKETKQHMTGYNFHTHTHYSDGKGLPEDFIKTALEQGMHAIGFSDHSPLPFDNGFSIKSNRLNDYQTEIRELQEKYRNRIEVYLALEMDYVPGMSADFEALAKEIDLDYTIGAVHLVGSDFKENLWFTDGPDRTIYDNGLAYFYQNDIKKAVGSFYRQTNEMIQSQKFDVIGHFDKIKMHNQDRYFKEDEAWYRDMVMECLQLIREKGLIVEINSRGLYKKRSNDLFPSDWILKQMHEWKVPTIISSDAHQADELQMGSEIAIQALHHAGYRAIMHFSKGQWHETALPKIV